MTTANTNLVGSLGLVASNLKLTGPANIAAALATAAKAQNGLTLGDLQILFGSATTGTASNLILNANQMYAGSAVIGATSYGNLNLYGSLKSPLGETIDFVTVTAILVAVASPDGAMNLQVGPQNQTHALQGPWGGTGATVYDVVYWQQLWLATYAGWTVSSGSHDTLGIYNPTAGNVTAQTLILGTQ